MVFYFSATGNSLNAARTISDGEPISIAQAVHDTNKVYKDEKIGVVCAIFGHEMPQLVKEFLQTSVFDTDYFYVILTYGARHGGAAEIAETFLRDWGIEPDYINTLLMVDNFLPVFDMDEEMKADKNVDECLEAINKDIQAKRHAISEVTEEDREVHRQFLKLASKMPKGAARHMFRVSGKCVACGICTKLCPKGCYSIGKSLGKEKAKWNPDSCIGCMACIHGCPNKAIRLNMPEKNKNARYRNPNVTLADLIEANDQNSKEEYENEKI